MKKSLLMFSVLAVILFIASGVQAAAVYTITNTNDAGAGSLRQAIAQANTTSEEDVINFDSQVFSTPKTITLTGGEMNVFYSVVIDGPGMNLLTISGNNQSRIFFNNFSNSVLTVRNLTLTQGFAVHGGAILTSNTLRLSNLLITDNKAMGADVGPAGFGGGLGGGIYSSGSLSITNSILSNNLASGIIVQNTTNPAYGDGGSAGGGGAIFSYGFEAIIVNCTFTGNTAKGISSPTAGEGRSGSQGGSAYGGALYGIFSFRIINSSFINNSAIAGNGASIVTPTGQTAGNGGIALGGAVYSSGTRVLNTTFSGNSVTSGNGGAAPAANNAGISRESSGGGIRDGDLKMANTTVVNNTVVAGSGRIGGDGSGGGIYGGSNQWSIVNSTVTGNSVTGGTGTEANGTSQGGGIFSTPDTGQASSFHNNIVAENSAASGADVFGNYVNPANNLVRIGEGSSGLNNGVNGNLIGTASSPINPLLGPLENNGGPTKTRALLAGSPAVNAGNNGYAINPFNPPSLLQFDQRNFERIAPSGGVIDIGAFELNASSVPAAASPDLQNASDTGLSDTDNITKAILPVFDVLNVIPGATVELLRNGVVVSATNAVSFSVSLSDPNPPLNGIAQYTSRQTISGGATSAVSPALTVTFDNTSPAVTLNQSPQQADPATALPILFTAVFSEPVGGFDRNDISFAGSTADLSTAGVFINTTNYSTYSIEISGIRSPGQIVLTILTGAAYDAALNYSTAPAYTDNSVTFQPNIVAVTIAGRIRRSSAVIKVPSTVTITDNFTGETWSTRTNNFGYYRFIGVPVYEQIGSRFTVRVTNKSFIFNAPQPVTITGDNFFLNYIVP